MPEPTFYERLKQAARAAASGGAVRAPPEQRPVRIKYTPPNLKDSSDNAVDLMMSPYQTARGIANGVQAMSDAAEGYRQNKDRAAVEAGMTRPPEQNQERQLSEKPKVFNVPVQNAVGSGLAGSKSQLTDKSEKPDVTENIKRGATLPIGRAVYKASASPLSPGIVKAARVAADAMTKPAYDLQAKGRADALDESAKLTKEQEFIIEMQRIRELKDKLRANN